MSYLDLEGFPLDVVARRMKGDAQAAAIILREHGWGVAVDADGAEVTLSITCPKTVRSDLWNHLEWQKIAESK